MNQPKPTDPVEVSIGKSVQAVVNLDLDKKLKSSRENVQDDSRVEPETGAVEITNQRNVTGQGASSSLYQSWTPSPTDKKEEENSQFPPVTTGQEDGDMSSESSPDSESASDKEVKCYMDIEESKSKSKSKR